MPFHVLNLNKSLTTCISRIDKMIVCGDIKTGFTLLTLHQDINRRYFPVIIKSVGVTPVISCGLFFFENSLRVITSDGKQNIKIYKISQNDCEIVALIYQTPSPFTDFRTLH
jgi:hypothetical protein